MKGCAQGRKRVRAALQESAHQQDAEGWREEGVSGPPAPGGTTCLETAISSPKARPWITHPARLCGTWVGGDLPADSC